MGTRDRWPYHVTVVYGESTLKTVFAGLPAVLVAIMRRLDIQNHLAMSLSYDGVVVDMICPLSRVFEDMKIGDKGVKEAWD